MKSPLFLLALTWSAPSMAQISLAADDQPPQAGWEQPATLAYTRNGDGSSTGTADAFLKYTFGGVRAVSGQHAAARQDHWTLGAYIHRDTNSEAPRNDRGIAAGYLQEVVFDTPNHWPPMYFVWGGNVALGKSLEGVEMAGINSYVDRNKDRESLYFSSFIWPAVSGPAGQSGPKHGLSMYFNWRVGLYSDHSAGGNGAGNGRLSGSMADIAWNILPFGIVMADKHIGGYGVVPVLTLAAQVQRDASASGSRVRDTYRLYSASLTLEFNTIAAGGRAVLQPSLNLSRTVGADLLHGRPYQGKTEFALGLRF